MVNIKKEVMKILKIQFWGIILVNVLILVLFMTGLLPQGYFATDKNMIYVLSVACVFITLGDIYLSWRMLGTAKAKKQVRKQGFNLYSVKCQIRIILMLAATVMTLVSYFLTLETSIGFCWLISMLALWLVYPSMKEYNSIVNGDETAE